MTTTPLSPQQVIPTRHGDVRVVGSDLALRYPERYLGSRGSDALRVAEDCPACGAVGSNCATHDE